MWTSKTLLSGEIMFNHPDVSYKYLQDWWVSLKTGLNYKIGLIERFDLPLQYGIKEATLPCGKRVLGVIVDKGSDRIDHQYFSVKHIFPLLSLYMRTYIFHPVYRDGVWRIVEGWEK